MATEEESAAVFRMAWLRQLMNTKDDDSSDSDSDSSSNGSGSESDGNRPTAAPQSLAVGEKNSNAVITPSSQKQQPRRSSRVPPVKKEKATPPKKKKKTTTVKKKKDKKEKEVPSDVESESGSSDGSDSSSEGNAEAEEERKKQKKKEKKEKKSSSKMTRVASQRDHRAKEPAAKKPTASEVVVVRNKSDRKVFEKVTKTLVKKEAAVKKMKVKKALVMASDSSSSDTGSGSDSNDSDSDGLVKKKKKSGVKASKTTRAPSPSVIRKREITAKERVDRAPRRVDSVLKEESTSANENPADPDAKRIKLLILNKGIESELKMARSRPSSASRKRPLPGTPSRSDNEEVAVEKKLPSRGRDRSLKEKVRREVKASSSLTMESVSKSLSQEKETSSSDTSKKKTKEPTQEELDRRLAIALGSRKSDRSRRRTGSEDTLESVKKDPVAVIAAAERSKKRKRVEAITVSPSAVSSAIETSETPKVKPEKKLRKASVDTGNTHVDDSAKTIEKQKSVKILWKSSEGNAGVAAAAKKPSVEEKLTPTKRVIRKGSRDLSAKVNRDDGEEPKLMRSMTPSEEKERDEMLSRKKKERKPAHEMEEKEENKVKPESGVGKKDSRRAKPMPGVDNEAVRRKKLVLGVETERTTRKMKVESGAEKEAVRKVRTEPNTRRGPDDPATEQRPNGTDSVVKSVMPSDAVKSKPTSEKQMKSEPANSENDVKVPIHAEELTASKEMKRMPAAQAVGDENRDAADPVPKKQESGKLGEVKGKPRKILTTSDGGKEEGEEDEEGAVLEEPVTASTVPPKLEMLGDDTKEEKNDGSVAKPVVDLMSFVIPKKKFKKAEEPSSARVAATSSMPSRINASIWRTPASSPLPQDPEGSNDNTEDKRVPDERASSRQRRRKKNPVPLSIPPPSREEKEFTRLAKRMNSILEACRKVHAITGGSKTSSAVGPYDVVGSDGKVIPDFIPRMKCPTKKQMKTQTDQFPSPFFGVSMSLPTAARTEESSPEQPEVPTQSDVVEAEINSYEQLVFERPEDRDVYQKKMYGTTFVPQLLRGRTTLIMRNVRYERKSTGFQFNTDRDREDFSKELSERYTMNKTVPRCDIPPKNWQQLVKKVPAVLYLHYMNREDGELAAQRFVDDNGVPLERKRTDRFGAIISAGNSPAPQLTPRRSRSTERSGPESSPVVSRKDNSSREPVPGARNWQPFHDEQRSSDRRGDRNGSRSGRGPREWPPRYHDRGGPYNSNDSRGDRRQERLERERIDRPADQRYGARDMERTDGQRMHRRPRSRTRSRSRSRMHSQSVREYDENYWPSDGGEMDAGRRDVNRDFLDRRHDSQDAHSAEEDGGERRGSGPRQDEREDRSQPYLDIEEDSSQRSNGRRENFGRRDRARSESLGKENKDYPSDSKHQRSSQGDDMDVEGGRDQHERVESDRDAGRSRSPEQKRTEDAYDVNEEDRASRRDVDDDNRQHSSESFDSSNRRDDPYYHNGHGIGNRGDDRSFHDGEHEYGRRDRHSRRHSRSRSRSHPKQPHLHQLGRSEHEGRERVGQYDQHFEHGRDGGHFHGEFDDSNGYNFHHDDREQDRAYHRHGSRGGDEYAHQRNRPY